MDDNSKLVSSRRDTSNTEITSHAQIKKSSKDTLEEKQTGRNEALIGLGQDLHWLSSISVLNDLVNSDSRSVPNVCEMFPTQDESATVMRSDIDDLADFDYCQNICQFPSSIGHSQQQQANIDPQVSVTRTGNHERLSQDRMHLSNLKHANHGEIGGFIHNGHQGYSEIAENNFSIQSHTNLNNSVIQTNGYLDKYVLQSHTNLDKPGLPVKSKPYTHKNSDGAKSIYTNNFSNVDVPKILPPPALPHSRRRQPTVSMSDKHDVTVDFHEINMWNPVNILHHEDNVVNKRPGLSGRSSAPVFIEAGSSRQERDVGDTSQRNHKHSTNDVGKFTDGRDTTSSHLLSRARPQSAATAVFLNNIIYNQIDEGSIQDDSGSHDQRNGFIPSYGSIVISGLDVDQSGSYRSVKSSDSKDAFKTTTSASLLCAAPVSITSYDTQLTTSKWKYVFSHKKTKFHQMPIDDSMEFGAQSSLSKLNQGKANNSQPPDDENSEFRNNKSTNKAEHCDDVGRFGDKEANTKQEARTAVYHRRWYLLFLFSVSALLWNAIWSTWGPIAQSAKAVYDWSDGDIAMFTWLGNIPFLITMFPSAYLMDVTGMRPAMIVACGFMFLGAGFRCIPSDTGTATWLIRMGQFLNGMAGTIPNSGPALLSALWFPPNQRASATAISTVAGYMGASISFVIGPLLVPEPNYLSPVNGSYEHNQDLDDFDDSNSTSNTTSYQEQKDGIMNILYGECAVAGLLFILVLIYFPSKPPLPPSISASIPREKYLQGLKLLIRNKQFWVCALAFSIPIGVYEAWQVILDVILADQQISQETAGWLDFYATVGGCVSGLLVSKFADYFTRQMKLFLLVFYFLASVAILWFILVVMRIIPFDHVSIYAAIIIAGVFLDGGGPLFFELTIEVSYPVGEGVTSGFTQMLCAAAGIIFLSIVQIQSLGKTWINWCFFGCVSIAIPLLFFINTTYGRADIDDIDVDVPEPDQDNGDNQVQSFSDKNSLLGSSHF